MPPAYPPNVVELVNARVVGYDRALGLRFVDIGPEVVTAEVDTDARHLQPYGLVHGGVLAGMIETVCSVGAAMRVMAEGKNAVGLENNTSFLRAVRQGRLRCVGRPLFVGHRSQVWHADIHDARDRQVATGRVRLLILEPGSEADGATVAVPDL